MASIRVLNYMFYRRCVVAFNHSHTCTLYHNNITPTIRQNASYSTKKSVANVDPQETENKVQVGYAEVVKETTKSAAYLSVIIGGVGLTVLMFYVIFKELFSSNSPNGIYSKTLERCINHPKVADMLGQPIKAYGEETRRGRRNHVSHSYFMKNGVKHMRMKFYIQGTRRRATVSLEVYEEEYEKYEYRYIYVMVEDVARTVIKIEDNRESERMYKTDPEMELLS